MEIRILSLTAAGSDRVSVCFELRKGEKFERRAIIVSTEALTRLDLTKGECSEEQYGSCEREGRICSAYSRGLQILGCGSCSKNMLISKLIVKGEDRSAAVEAVERICAAGFLDEAESARRQAEIDAQKLWGESRIRAHLLQKKYSPQAVDGALFALEDSGVDFEENCRSAIRQRYKDLPVSREEMRKLIAAICRLGYSASQAQAACRSLRDEYRINSIYR